MKSFVVATSDGAARSLPSRERGLKYYIRLRRRIPRAVAPLAGARIEIDDFGDSELCEESLPSRERGLKCRSYRGIERP